MDRLIDPTHPLWTLRTAQKNEVRHPLSSHPTSNTNQATLPTTNAPRPQQKLPSLIKAHQSSASRTTSPTVEPQLPKISLKQISEKVATTFQSAHSFTTLDISEAYQHRLITRYGTQVAQLTGQRGKIEEFGKTVIELADLWQTNDFSTVAAIHACFISTQKQTPRDPNQIFLFRSQESFVRNIDINSKLVGNNPFAMAIIFDGQTMEVANNVPRDTAVQNSPTTLQGKHKYAGTAINAYGQTQAMNRTLISHSVNPLTGEKSTSKTQPGSLPHGGINFLVDSNPLRFQNNPYTSRNAENHSTNDTSRVNLQCTLKDVLDNKGKVYKDIGANYAKDAVIVELPNPNSRIPFEFSPSN